MALDWKKLVTPVSESKEFKSGSNAGPTLTPAQKTVANMDKALAAFKGGNKDVKRPVIVQKGDEVRFSVRFANRPLPLLGDAGDVVVPAAKFTDVYAAIREEVAAGKYDAQLAPLAAAAKARGANSAASRGKGKGKK